MCDQVGDIENYLTVVEDTAQKLADDICSSKPNSGGASGNEGGAGGGISKGCDGAIVGSDAGESSIGADNNVEGVAVAVCRATIGAPGRALVSPKGQAALGGPMNSIDAVQLQRIVQVRLHCTPACPHEAQSVWKHSLCGGGGRGGCSCAAATAMAPALHAETCMDCRLVHRYCQPAARAAAFTCWRPQCIGNGSCRYEVDNGRLHRPTAAARASSLGRWHSCAGTCCWFCAADAQRSCSTMHLFRLHLCCPSYEISSKQRACSVSRTSAALDVAVSVNAAYTLSVCAGWCHGSWPPVGLRQAEGCRHMVFDVHVRAVRSDGTGLPRACVSDVSRALHVRQRQPVACFRCVS
eukprot:366203-Chlamydomonas_euryale.AAC.13